MKTVIREIKNLMSLIYPETCIICSNVLSTSENHMCFSCSLEMPYYDDEVESMYKKFWGITSIDSCTSLFIYTKANKTQSLLKTIKYKRNEDLAVILGKELGSKISTKFPKQKIDYLLPVPLHKKKLKLRGFNQSEAIAIGIAQLLQIKVLKNTVIRIKNTRTQTRLDRVERWENVEEVFSVINKKEISGKRIALIDDVLTTGATLGNLALLLRKYHAREIHIFTLAVAL